MESEPKPHLKIVGMHVRALGPLRTLDLPQDGIAWEDNFPDVVVIGGPNGSGKTTLLEFLVYGLLHQLEMPPGLTGWTIAREAEAWLDLSINLTGLPPTVVRLLWGSSAFCTEHARPPYSALVRNPSDRDFYIMTVGDPRREMDQIYQRIRTRADIPAMIYIPTGDWPITFGEDADKALGLGPLPQADEFIYRWRAPQKWRESTEGLLYALRWADLNAREAGQEANLFKSYSEAFEQFFGKKKVLRWSPRGELLVELPGVRHGLSELSPGEQRILILLAELRYRWRPGSLVFIDEPELHLHSRWQLKLWDVLRQLREERGGQLILTTQSTDLFEVADHRSTVLLGDGLR